MKQAISIFYADDKEVFRKAVIRDLEPYSIVCAGEAGNGKELLRLLMNKKPDVVLLDLRMPEMNGNETMSLIAEKYPDVRVIILSWYREEILVEDYISRGARAYLSKDEISGNIDVLAGVIRRVQAGEIVLDVPVPKKTKKTAPFEKYSRRQKEIITLMCEGKTNQEISEETGILQRSVEKQRHKIYEKTNSMNAPSFFRYAFERGLQFLGNKKD